MQRLIDGKRRRGRHACHGSSRECLRDIHRLVVAASREEGDRDLACGIDILNCGDAIAGSGNPCRKDVRDCRAASRKHGYDIRRRAARLRERPVDRRRGAVHGYRAVLLVDNRRAKILLGIRRPHLPVGECDRPIRSLRTALERRPLCAGVQVKLLADIVVQTIFAALLYGNEVRLQLVLRRIPPLRPVETVLGITVIVIDKAPEAQISFRRHAHILVEVVMRVCGAVHGDGIVVAIRHQADGQVRCRRERSEISLPGAAGANSAGLVCINPDAIRPARARIKQGHPHIGVGLVVQVELRLRLRLLRRPERRLDIGVKSIRLNPRDFLIVGLCCAVAKEETVVHADRLNFVRKRKRGRRRTCRDRAEDDALAGWPGPKTRAMVAGVPRDNEIKRTVHVLEAQGYLARLEIESRHGHRRGDAHDKDALCVLGKHRPVVRERRDIGKVGVGEHALARRRHESVRRAGGKLSRRERGGKSAAERRAGDDERRADLDRRATRVGERTQFGKRTAALERHAAVGLARRDTAHNAQVVRRILARCEDHRAATRADFHGKVFLEDRLFVGSRVCERSAVEHDLTAAVITGGESSRIHHKFAAVQVHRAGRARGVAECQIPV